MPLNEGAKPGSKGFGENVATEMRAGKKQEQAVAIAYKESGEKNDADETSAYKGHEIEKRGETYYISKNGRRSTGYWDSLNSARIAIDKGLLKSLEKNDASLLMDAVSGLRGKVEVAASKVDGFDSKNTAQKIEYQGYTIEKVGGQFHISAPNGGSAGNEKTLSAAKARIIVLIARADADKPEPKKPPMNGDYGTKYNAEAVQKEINKDKRIGPGEAKKIHAVLKGWRGDSNEEKADASGRMYPSYTTADLKSWLSDPKVPDATKEKARAEIAARESGASKHKVTPQVPWGVGGKKADGLEPSPFGRQERNAKISEGAKNDSSPAMEAFKARQAARIARADAGIREADALMAQVDAALRLFKKAGSSPYPGRASQAKDSVKSMRACYGLAKNNLSEQAKFEDWAAKGDAASNEAASNVRALVEAANRLG